MPNLTDFVPIIIPALVLLSALFAFIATSVGKTEEKKLLSKVTIGLFAVLVIAAAATAWYLVDSAFAENRVNIYHIDQQLTTARVFADSLQKELTSRDANSMAMSLMLEESQAQLTSLEKTMAELETKIADLSKNRRSKDNAIAALEKEKRALKDKMVEVARAAQKKVQAARDSIATLAVQEAQTEKLKKANSRLVFKVTASDTAGNNLYRNTYYSFFAEPPGTLENVSIYFKFDRPFLQIEDVSDDQIRGRRSSFFAEAGNAGVFYRISSLAQGETIVLRLSGNDFIKPRPLEPPLLSP